MTERFSAPYLKWLDEIKMDAKQMTARQHDEFIRYWQEHQESSFIAFIL